MLRDTCKSTTVGIDWGLGPAAAHGTVWSRVWSLSDASLETAILDRCQWCSALKAHSFLQKMSKQPKIFVFDSGAAAAAAAASGSGGAQGQAAETAADKGVASSDPKAPHRSAFSGANRVVFSSLKDARQIWNAYKPSQIIGTLNVPPPDATASPTPPRRPFHVAV